MHRVPQLFLAFVAAYFLSRIIPLIWMPAISACSASGILCMGYIAPLTLTGIVVTGLIALYLSVTNRARLADTQESTSKVAFPHGGTVSVLIWLLSVLSVYIYLFIKVIVPESIDENATFWLMILDKKIILEASVAFLAAGIGSTVSTMFSFLDHASTQADWKQSHVPWYILRPIQGSVLGVIFYWLMRGGLLTILPADDSHGDLVLDLNGLAGMCALVGMFSRRAMIKLRETFQVIFATKEDDDLGPDMKPPGDAGNNR